MSERNEFDDLVRRKLEERQIDHQEADWLAAQRLIQAQRGSTPWRKWAIGGAAVLLIAGVTWWMNEEPTLVAATVPLQEIPERAAVTKKASTHLNDPASSRTAPRSLEQTNDKADAHRRSIGASATSNEHVDPVHVTEPLTKASMATAPKTNGRGALASGIASKTSPSRPSQPKTSLKDQPVPSTTGGRDQARSQTDGLGANSTVAVDALPAKDPDPMPIATTTEGNGEIPLPNSGDAMDAPVTMEPGLPKTAATVQDGSTNNSNDHRQEASLPLDVAKKNEPLDTATPATVSTTTSDHTSTALNIAATDTAAAITSNEQATSSAQDTLTAAVPPVTAAAPLVTPASPWELSVLFGGLLSSSTYQGGNSGEWNAGLKGAWSTAYGAEFMHMGRNFGLGSGLHYSTYQEQLSVDERSLSTTVIRDSNYFQPVDTAILYVLGLVEINGQQWYVTESRDTTLNFLVLGTASSTTTRKVFDALQVVNRVSYLEIPLLVDGHLQQGGWMIGVRGGPTVGLLSGRRMTLPNTAFDGYEPLASEQFRTPIIGLTARAYIRYRFTNGWSIGLEPTWRGQLGNAFGTGDLVRRNSAFGGLMSVSYRLR